ncbi:MAG: T9SS type A sorting domain-containing protein [Bacteroidales bacterium]|nr:T9SS type A sorting domain-containing protein [Bacteroidales bacterium]
MKTRLRVLCTALVALMIPLGMHAQEDVTALYLTNPSFEEGTYPQFTSSGTVPGWDVTDFSYAYQNNDADATKDGTYILGIWSPTNIADWQLSQTIDSVLVPPGTYIISCLMTVPTGDNTTQRLFAKAGNVTRVTYYAESSLDTIDGEEYSFAGLPVDGNGRGPFRELSVRIKVLEGDTLTIGVRTNGQKSTICNFSEVGGAGWFKCDRFRLSLLNNETAFAKEEIDKNLLTIQAVPTDAVPGGYAGVIENLLLEADDVLVNENNLDSLNAFNDELVDFIAELKVARATFDKMMNLLLKVENVLNATSLSGKDILQNAYDDAYEVYFSFESFIPEFNAAYDSLNAAFHTYAVGRVAEPLSRLSNTIVTTSHVSGWEKLSAVNDGLVAAAYNDDTYPKYGNWNGDADYGKTNWIQYEWPFAHTITEVSVYWWSDDGGLGHPTEGRIEYWQNNEWKLAGPIDTVMSAMNTAKFDFKSNKVRLYMRSETSVGVSEFTVTGLQKLSNDITDYKQMLQDEVNSLNAVNVDSLPKGYGPLVSTNLQSAQSTIATEEVMDNVIAKLGEIRAFILLIDSAATSYNNLSAKIAEAKKWIDESSFDEKAALQTAYDAALVIFNASGSLKADFNAAITPLNKAIYDYTVGEIEVNLGQIPTTTITTSYIPGWNTLESMVDGFDPADSNDGSHGSYGNWQGEENYGITNWVQFEWPVEHKITSVAVYWFSNGDGVTAPVRDSLEYWKNDAWVYIDSITSYLNQYNEKILDITTSKLRLSMASVSATGIIEFKIMGFETPYTVGLKNPAQRFDGVSISQTIVKRGGSVDVAFAAEQSKPVSVEIFAISGQRMGKATLNGQFATFNVPSTLNSGLYLMVFNTAQGRSVKKLVVE